MPSNRRTSGGYIVRTAGEGASAEALQQDRIFLRKLWQSIQERVATAKPGSMVHEDLTRRCGPCATWPAVPSRRCASIRANPTCARSNSPSSTSPRSTQTLEHYPGERPIFDLYAVEDEIQKSLERKVQLKSGGYLIIDQTEALTTIDINTGAFVGSRNLEETIFKTNLEAAQAIARQLRVRNLGGIIIIDFIDMTQEEHKQQVRRALESAVWKKITPRVISAVCPRSGWWR